MTAIPANGANFVLGRGNLFIDRWLAGARTGYKFLGNCPKFEFDTADDVLEINSSCEAAAPLALSVVKKRVVTVNVALDEYTADNIALNLMGLVATYSQTTGTVTDEVLTASVVKGNYYKVAAGRRLTAISLKKSPSTPLVAGTDFDVIDAEAGLIYIRPGGGVLTNGDIVLVTYTKATITAETKIQGGVSTVIDATLLYIPDVANGPKDEIEVWHVQINNDGAMGFITQDDIGHFAIKAKVIADATHTGETLYRVIPRP